MQGDQHCGPPLRGNQAVHLLHSSILVFAMALSGCAGLEQRAPGDRLEFELAGRIAVRYRSEAASGNLAWRHTRESDEMLMTTPIGSSVARIIRTGAVVVLTTADGREYRAADAETLTEQALGFRLPLVGLADWVRGRPVDSQPAVSRHDAQGRLAVLEQSGWRIEYQAFRPDGLPERLRLEYPGIELRLAIHEWKQSGDLPSRQSMRGPAD